MHEQRSSVQHPAAYSLQSLRGRSTISRIGRGFGFASWLGTSRSRVLLTAGLLVAGMVQMAPAAVRTKMKGVVQKVWAAGDADNVYKFTNATGIPIGSFNISLDAACTSSIQEVKVVSKWKDRGGTVRIAGDWDIDDDRKTKRRRIGTAPKPVLTSRSNEGRPKEWQDTDSVLDKISRVDRFGDRTIGNLGFAKKEPRPQGSAVGRPIGFRARRKGVAPFNIYVKLNAAPAAACTLTIAPRNSYGLPLGTFRVAAQRAGIPETLQCGDNAFVMTDPFDASPGMIVSTVNGSGQTIDSLNFLTSASVFLVQVVEGNSDEDSILSSVDCGIDAGSCSLPLVAPVEPGGIVKFEVYLDNVPLDTNVDLTVAASCSTPTSPTGDCCGIEGLCDVYTEASCNEAGGAFQGDAQTCTVCTAAATGACCFLDGSCGDDALQFECEGSGAVFQGDASVCGATGSCCLPSGECVETSLECCTATGGSFNGPGSVCNPVGACCLEAESLCVETPLTCCAASGGTYRGNATDCLVEDCPGTLVQVIPATSEWGLVVIMLSLLAAGTILLRRASRETGSCSQ